MLSTTRMNKTRNMLKTILTAATTPSPLTEAATDPIAVTVTPPIVAADLIDLTDPTQAIAPAQATAKEAIAQRAADLMDPTAHIPLSLPTAVDTLTALRVTVQNPLTPTPTTLMTLTALRSTQAMDQTIETENTIKCELNA